MSEDAATPAAINVFVSSISANTEVSKAGCQSQTRTLSQVYLSIYVVVSVVNAPTTLEDIAFNLIHARGPKEPGRQMVLVH